MLAFHFRQRFQIKMSIQSRHEFIYDFIITGAEKVSPLQNKDKAMSV